MLFEGRLINHNDTESKILETLKKILNLLSKNKIAKKSVQNLMDFRSKKILVNIFFEEEILMQGDSKKKCFVKDDPNPFINLRHIIYIPRLDIV